VQGYLAGRPLLIAEYAQRVGRKPNAKTRAARKRASVS
jgi:hypothetical protein